MAFRPDALARQCRLALCLLGLAQAAQAETLRLAAATQIASQGDPRGATMIEADLVHAQTSRYLEAEGKVVARNLVEVIRADWLRYDEPADEIEATGQVSYERDTGRIEGLRLRLKLTEHIGRFDTVQYSFPRANLVGRGNAETLHFEGRDHYRLAQATYTTCPADGEDWILRATELDLDYVGNLGLARHTRIEYLGTPILYAPWFDFGLDNGRKTGLLTPTMGASERRGFEYAQPWYWNIAPNRDATLMPRLMTRRGLQMAGEFRYLETGYQGDVQIEVLPGDRVSGNTRHHSLLRHQQQFNPRLHGSLTLEDASDDSYFADLSSAISDTSRVHLPREATLNYTGDWWQAGIRLQSFETLNDPNDATTLPTYERLPQLTLSAAKTFATRLPLQFNLTSEGVRFEHELDDYATGNRLHLYPSLTLPAETEYGFLRSKLGWHFTHYDLERNNVSADARRITRSLPIASLDGGLFFDRDFTWRGSEFRQTLEPRAYYLFIPYRKQDDIPNFDTGVADLSLYQLFSENQFVGGDRVNDANQLTLAVTSRFIDTGSGIERFQLTLGQRHYFNDQHVVLPGGTPRGSNVTDLLVQASGQLTDHLRLGTGLQYNPDNAEWVRANAGAQYQPAPGKVVNLDLRYINENYGDPVKQIDLSWQWPLRPKWSNVGRLNYSFEESRMVEALLGFEYNAGCWSLRGVAQTLALSSEESNLAFYLQLELRGLTKIGVSPLDLLQRSITGYRKSDEIDLP
jgi:LPS-assembly protein